MQFNFKTYLVEPLYRDDNQFLWDFGDAGQQHSDDQEVITRRSICSRSDGARTGRHGNGASGGDSDGRRERADRDAPTPDEQPRSRRRWRSRYRYDEWDYAIGLDRPAWCTLLEKRARAWAIRARSTRCCSATRRR